MTQSFSPSEVAALKRQVSWFIFTRLRFAGGWASLGVCKVWIWWIYKLNSRVLSTQTNPKLLSSVAQLILLPREQRSQCSPVHLQKKRKRHRVSRAQGWVCQSCHQKDSQGRALRPARPSKAVAFPSQTGQEGKSLLFPADFCFVFFRSGCSCRLYKLGNGLIFRLAQVLLSVFWKLLLRNV